MDTWPSLPMQELFVHGRSEKSVIPPYIFDMLTQDTNQEVN